MACGHFFGMLKVGVVKNLVKPVVDAAVLVPFYPEMSRLVCHEDVGVQLQVCEALAAIPIPACTKTFQ